MRAKGYLTRLLVILALLFVLCPVVTLVAEEEPVLAVTTANITITVTPGIVTISCNVSSYDYGTVALSTTANTLTNYFGITNGSTLVTNHSIGVTGATWTGGATPWTHSDTATAGADTAGMKASKGTGAFDVIVKNAGLNNIATNQAATTNYNFETQMVLPTSTTVTNQKTNVVQITASAA